MTLGGNRKDKSGRGLASLGRPRRTSFSPRYKSASEIQVSVISGGVSASCETGLELFRFALMAMPHTDDASCGAARRPCEHDKPGIDPPRRDEARLAVVLPIICASEVRPGKDFLCSSHVQTTFLQRPFAFCTGRR